ncbi:16378_t:CDS:1 [Racocetra fulgida]|uniref:16378_t:CDS:1 n=1 Tax=Racocetra fulgida TaxID=60492 RepID=A0A9N9C7Y2_9GLOM|nr:16378_t:CDS:1 [Racocetra fulgida]
MNLVTNPLEVKKLLFELTEKTKHDKEIAYKLLNRISATDFIVKRLRFEEEINAHVYNKDLESLIKVLSEINTVVQTKNCQKFFLFQPINERFNKLINEYDDCIRSLNLSISIDNREYIKKIEQDIHDVKEEIGKSNLVGQEKQLSDHLKQITSLSNQSEQIGEILTKNEQEIADFEILIEHKQNEMIKKEKESEGSSIGEKEKMQLEKQITDLKNQIVNLQNLLNEKEEELSNLRQKNYELVEQCLHYLILIKSFREKQKEINEIREELTKKIPSKEELDNLLYLQEEFNQLETELEKLVSEISLIKNNPLKKRYFNFNQLQVDQITIDNSDKVITELKDHDLFEEYNDLSYLNEELQMIIENSNKNAIRNALLIVRAKNSKLNLPNSHHINILKEKDINDIKEKTMLFLERKQIFLNTHQGTIWKLEKCYEKFKSSIDTRKFAIFTEMKHILTAGYVVPVVGSKIKAIGGASAGVVNIFKTKRQKKCRKKFQKYLSNDEKKLFWFKERYQSLFDVLYKEKQSLSSTIINILKLEKYKKKSSFNDKYNICRIISGISFQGENTLELQEMKQTITLLESNLEELRAELEEEKKNIYEQIQIF